MHPHEIPDEYESRAKGAKPQSPTEPEAEAPQPGAPIFPDVDLSLDDAELYDAFDPHEEAPLPEPDDFCFDDGRFDDGGDEEDFPFAA